MKQGGGAGKWLRVSLLDLASYLEHERYKLVNKRSLCILDISVLSTVKSLLAFCLFNAHVLSLQEHARINIISYMHLTV